MSKSVNRWVGLGNIGKDPEVKSTSGGTLVANFSIATTSPREKLGWQLAGPKPGSNRPCSARPHG